MALKYIVPGGWPHPCHGPSLLLTWRPWPYQGSKNKQYLEAGSNNIKGLKNKQYLPEAGPTHVNGPLEDQPYQYPLK